MSDTNDVKSCTKCGLQKPIAEFNNDKRRPDGKFPWCKSCKRGSDAKYRSENAEKIADYKRGWYRENQESTLVTNRRWREENRERKAASDAAYYRNNRAEILEYTKAWKASRIGTRSADRPWPKRSCGYAAVHDRVKAVRGLATSYPCTDCKGQAQEWSYNRASVQELVEWGLNPRGEKILRPYSTNLNDYEPRCIPCHRKYDSKKKESLAS